MVDPRARRLFFLSSSSGSPFETEIGVGKVIKGWDEGEFEVERAILRVLLLFDVLFVLLFLFQFCSWLSTRSGVIQLSLGQKAILKCSADYVCSFHSHFCCSLLLCLSTLIRPTVLVVSHP